MREREETFASLKEREFFGVVICRLAEIGNFAGTNFCFHKSFCPVKVRGGVTTIRDTPFLGCLFSSRN